MLLAKALSRVIGEGRLTIIDAAGERHTIEGSGPGPTVTMRVHDRWTALRLVLRPRLALGEAYMDGTVTVEDGDIYALLDLLGRNMAAVESTPMVRWSY
ncbi:MAG TPA: SAM-dependent methyltransferase, partial [Reyranellaceae bacterium]|nr:SAM-dependent methyltransferase [Reyranellaceae bacterium]